MILVVEAIGRFACGCLTQSTAPVVASTRIPERAPIVGEPSAGGAGVESSFGGEGESVPLRRRGRGRSCSRRGVALQVAHGQEGGRGGDRKDEQREHAPAAPPARALDGLEDGVPHGHSSLASQSAGLHLAE